MSLSKLFEDLDNLITNKRPISEIKPILTLLRDQAEALEASHAALEQAHSKLQSDKSEVDKELARLKETNASKDDDPFELGSLGDLG